MNERFVFGNSRLGVYSRYLSIRPAIEEPLSFTRGNKYYELSNHLGNVNSVISDRKIQVSAGIYRPDIKSYVDYYPFGYQMATRTWQQSLYRYGFNGQEKDDEIYGAGNSTTAEFWQYDTRLGRRWNMDPTINPEISDYAVFNNNPVFLIDPDGESPISIFAKLAAKVGIKKAAKETIEAAVKNRLKTYMSKKWASQLAKDAIDAIDIATSQSWWEYAVELIPVVGDIYGSAKLGKQGYNVYKITQKFESVMDWASTAAGKAWKTLGANNLIGKGADKLGDYTRKFNNQGSHLNESDLAGAVKEIYGLSSGVSGKTGKAYQHLDEVTNTLDGMRKQIKGLSNDIQNGVFDGDALDAAKGILNDVTKQYNEITNTLNSAKKAAKNF